MKLCLIGNNCKYAIEQIMLAMFQEERPEYVEKPTEDNCAVCKLNVRNGRAYASTAIYRDGNVFRGRAGTDIPEDISEREQNRIHQWLLRRSFYNAGVKATGKNPAWGSLTGIRPAKLTTEMLQEGLSEKEAFGVMNKRYKVSEERAKLCIDVSKAGLAAKKLIEPRDISLYVGIPFCPTRCAYCSFVSHSVEKSLKLIEPYLEALFKEIEYGAQLVKRLGLRIRSVYIGGGTPTTLSARQLSRLMGTLSENFDLSNILEYTVEAGRPDTIDEEKLMTLKENGADRVSINPQTMEDDVLRAIGRRHSAEDVIKAFELARKAGFDNINMDLIAGLPDDSEEGFKRTLDTVCELKPENITIHTLSLKKGSRIALERSQIPTGEEVERMLRYSREKLRKYGYGPYYLYRQKFMAGSFENIGWSVPKKDCLYNIYIMEEMHTILSLGAGGSTKLVDPHITRIERIFNYKYPNEYILNIDKVMSNKDYMVKFYSEILNDI